MIPGANAGEHKREKAAGADAHAFPHLDVDQPIHLSDGGAGRDMDGCSGAGRELW